MSSERGRSRNQSDWRLDAACKDADPDLFFYLEGVPRARNEQRARKAKEICADCPVVLFCLKDALQNNEMGVWGGTTERERWDSTRRSRMMSNLKMNGFDISKIKK